MAPSANSSVPQSLPEIFTYEQLLQAGLTKHQVYRLRQDGVIENLARGLYRRAGDTDVDLALATVATLAPKATLCLTTALAVHELTDAIPAASDIALPRNVRRPAVLGSSVAWHKFDPETFDIGRGFQQLDEHTRIGLYSPERSIIDAFRLRGVEGPEQAHEALRRWLRRPGNQPMALLDMARAFPRAATGIRKALEVLL